MPEGVYPASKVTRRILLPALGLTSCLGGAPRTRPRRPRRVRRPWRGFNLQEKFTHEPDEWSKLAPEWGRANEPFRESDFDLIAQLGFNFVRLPMSYRCWTDPADPFALKESTMRDIDDAVRWGQEYGIHVCLNFHRAPGYCINGALAPEPWDLWNDTKPREILQWQWREFAARYREIGSEWLSFNPINEPSRCTIDQYVSVMDGVIGAIRDADPSRLIVIDGMFGEASLPIPALASVSSTLQSTRGYAPFSVSHYRASWAIQPDRSPSWPMPIDRNNTWDKPQLDRWCITPFRDLEVLKGRVIVGEWGCYNKTPHAVALAWMRDFLSLWKGANWDWALWCFRGSFGILDSERSDVQYEPWMGHSLDRRMLDLLRE